MARFTDWEGADDIRACLEALDADRDVMRETNLGGRARGLGTLDLVDAWIRVRSRWQDLDALQAWAAALRERLVAVDQRLFRRLRDEIRAGRLRGDALRAYLDRFTAYRPRQSPQRHTGYDDLDALWQGLLRLDQPPAAERQPEAEMIGLEFTPVRVILALVDRVSLPQGAIFYDIGAGLGQVAILVHLLTGVETRGIEVEPAYCHFARTQAAELGLAKVRFYNLDARHTDYAQGHCFFLFSPFHGEMLQTVLDKLAATVAQHPRMRGVFRLCTYGPCTPAVAAVPWLRAVGGRTGSGTTGPETSGAEFELAVFRAV